MVQSINLNLKQGNYNQLCKRFLPCASRPVTRSLLFVICYYPRDNSREPITQVLTNLAKEFTLSRFLEVPDSDFYSFLLELRFRYRLISKGLSPFRLSGTSYRSRHSLTYFSEINKGSHDVINLSNHIYCLSLELHLP